MKKNTIVKETKNIILKSLTNLIRNWYFPISSISFFCLSASLTPEYFISLLIAFIISIFVAAKIPSILVYIRQSQIRFHIVAFLTAIGICWAGQALFYENWKNISQFNILESTLPIQIDIYYFSILISVVAIFFVYFCVLLFYRELENIISRNNMLNSINNTERIIYSILIIASLIFMVVVFAQTEAFYGTEYAYDIIYVSDSPSLVKGNVYMSLTHPENDLRQPLFAVFAAPFVGIPYLIGKLFGVSASIQAMLLNSVQVVMLFVANYILTKMLRLNSLKRICFMFLTSCTYTYLLFILMMEQYVVAYFWLILFMYLISEEGRPDRIAFWGAGGSLLTSMVLLPFMSDRNPIGCFKGWCADIIKYGLEFIMVMLAFCRFDVIYNLVNKISSLRRFTGKSLTMTNKIYQYTEFIYNCFFAPNASVNSTAVNHISWQLNIVKKINYIGVVILLFVIVSAILNRRKKSSLLAAIWVVFSLVMLVGLGWGTKENGLILYSLYFGWAFLVLVFQLIDKVGEKLKIKLLVPMFSIVCTITFAVINIPEIMKMVNFAITNFPVRR